MLSREFSLQPIGMSHYIDVIFPISVSKMTKIPVYQGFLYGEGFVLDYQHHH